MQTLTKIRPLNPVGNTIQLGADPELFLLDTRTNQIIGSEKVIPKEGTQDDPYNRVVRDGVQVEFNPCAATCRESVRHNLARCFTQLREVLNKTKDIKPVFNVTVKVSQKEMNQLHPDSRIFGCKPSFNIYNEGTDKTSKIEVDPLTYLNRSAGGHIHMGRVAGYAENKLLDNPQRTIQMLDILVGNTCVLMDRDPGNKERRKVYGKAGEYRTPPHGLEYRTLSNFWLQSYPLASFVLGMTRFSLHLLAHSTKENPYEELILNTVDINDIRTAIDTNNKTLAMKNFRKIQRALLKFSKVDETDSQQYTRIPLNNKNIKDFHYFIKKGVKHWFPNDPMQNWDVNNKNHTLNLGWETFLMERVRPALKKDLAANEAKRTKLCSSPTTVKSTTTKSL